MHQDSFTTTFTVPRTPQQVFDVISDVRRWWEGKIDGSADRLGAEFTYRYEDLHRSTQKVTTFEPGQKIVWRVTDGHIAFVDDKKEWNGTEIVFELKPDGANKTELTFTHRGLVPSLACYDDCRGGWTQYVNGSLRRCLTTS